MMTKVLIHEFNKLNDRDKTTILVFLKDRSCNYSVINDLHPAINNKSELIQTLKVFLFNNKDLEQCSQEILYFIDRILNNQEKSQKLALKLYLETRKLKGDSNFELIEVSKVFSLIENGKIEVLENPNKKLSDFGGN